MTRPYHRVGLTPAQSAELWERWKKGEGLNSIGRVFGKTSSCVFAHIKPSGGIRPPPRRRSRLALTLAEREEISRGLVAGAISGALKRQRGFIVTSTKSGSERVYKIGGAMNVAEEAGTALAHAWETMVVLAEAGNDMVVAQQRLAAADGAGEIAEIAANLSALSRAAEVLARLWDRA